MVAPEISKYLSNWKHDPWAMRALFDETEFSSLETSRRQVRKDRRTIAVCFYENFFAAPEGCSRSPVSCPRRSSSEARRSSF